MIVDISRLAGRLLAGRLPTGVDRVDIEYVRHFSHRCDALVRYRGKWIFFSHDDSLKLFDILIQHDSSKLWMIRRMVAWYYFFSAAIPSAERKLLNISHSGLDQDAYRQKLKQYRLKPIFFVHDLIPITHPEYSRPNEDILHQYRMETVLRYAAGIIVNSHDTLKHLDRYAHNHSLPMPQVAVAHLAAAPLSSSRSKSLMTKPYFVMLGTIEPRKNHWLMLHVWRQIIERLGEKSPTLLIIGQRGWECENVVDMLERCDSIRPYVIEKSRCSDKELFGYLEHAQALLFPSFVEGYGMPLVESLSIGTPVIASDLSVFKEIAGNIPEYLSPLDGIGWEAMIVDYSDTNSTKRSAQMERLKNFISPTWKKHFEIIDEFLG